MLEPQSEFWPLIVAILMLGASAIVLLFRMSYVDRRYRHWLVVPATTLPLFLLGTDQMRWASMFFQSVIVVLVYLAINCPNWRWTMPRANAVDRASLIVCGFPMLGPLGISIPFPALEDFLQLVSRVTI